MEATIPNSTKICVWVIIKVAKPAAVVALVIKVAFPTFCMTLLSALTLFPCCLYSLWYLFKRKIQLGIPITIISGGISAVRTVILKPRRCIVPIAHITPIPTTNME